MESFYFGCWTGRAGHYLHDIHGTECERSLPRNFPVKPSILDSGLLPPNSAQTEGLATLVHIGGWTIVTFWDRSGDRRGNSNSSFVLEGIHSFEKACEISAGRFPLIWSRFKFQIVEAK